MNLTRLLLIVAFGLAVALAILFFVVGGLEGGVDDEADDLGAVPAGARHAEAILVPSLEFGLLVEARRWPASVACACRPDSTRS